MKATLLITGQNGQIATALQNAAEARGYCPILLTRPSFDLAKPAALKAAMHAILERVAGSTPAPIGLVNAAAYTGVDKAESEEDIAAHINGVSPGVLAEAAADFGIPFVHISTDYVFDGSKAGAYVETDPTAPLGAYGRTKLMGEEAVRTANPNALILRTSWVFSPWGHNFLKSMLRFARERDKLTIVADQHGCPTYAPHFAEALLVALTKKASASGSADKLANTYHLCGTGHTSWHGFADYIIRQAGAAGLLTGPLPEVAPISTADYPTPAKRPQNSVMDTSKFTATFGTAMPSWQQGVDDCLAALKPALAGAD